MREGFKLGLIAAIFLASIGLAIFAPDKPSTVERLVLGIGPAIGFPLLLMEAKKSSRKSADAGNRNRSNRGDTK